MGYTVWPERLTAGEVWKVSQIKDAEKPLPTSDLSVL